jgi:hypothetical protein
MQVFIFVPLEHQKNQSPSAPGTMLLPKPQSADGPRSIALTNPQEAGRELGRFPSYALRRALRSAANRLN